MQNEEVQQVEAETEGIKPVVTLLPCIANVCPVHINVYVYIHTKIDIYKTSEQPLKSTGLRKSQQQ